MTYISICIPAYKRTFYLKRLLDSIIVQTYKNFEVIITDDSNDDSVEQLVKQYSNEAEIKYVKNNIALGSPENWNEAIRIATGNWIKIMHDDDWFADKEALSSFCHAIESYPDCSFVFSGYQNIYENNKMNMVLLNTPKRFFLYNPIQLIAENVIGPPSVVIYKKRDSIVFDSSL
ncbi:MAG TPA: glycosyltransferase family 2 protein, partial [Flavisolibacter sp.]|nr:glycosyltransferase family 2 protein [Flavisolibacter sp.]